MNKYLLELFDNQEEFHEDFLNDYFLTPKEVSQILGISVQGVHKLCKELKIPTQFNSKVHKIYPRGLNEILVKRFGSLNSLHKGCKKIAIHSVKGGPGKTTLTHTLGSRASAYGFKTLVIDLDKQANLTNSLGVEDEEDDGVITTFDLFEFHQGKKSYNSMDALIPITDHLYLLPSNTDLANFDLSLSKYVSNIGTLFKKLLKKFEDEFDVIIFDLPPDFNRLTIAAHAFCDLVLIPVNMNKFSMKGIVLTLDHLELVKEEYNDNFDYKIIANKVDQRSATTYDLIAKLKLEFKGRLHEVLIPVCKPIEDAFLNSTNVWKAPRANSALSSIDSIVQDLLEVNSWKKVKRVNKSIRQVKNSRNRREAIQ